MVSGKSLTTAVTAFLLIVFVSIIAAAFIFSGLYNIAATTKHAETTVWVLNKLKDHSIMYHAQKITLHPMFTEAEVASGFRHYDEMCIRCHGAPGIECSEIGKGLNPPPPDLSKVAKQWSPGELYWIVQNGIKMTGMPAFGVTHAGRELWGIVAFLKRLPELSPAGYRELDEKLADRRHGHND